MERLLVAALCFALAACWACTAAGKPEGTRTGASSVGAADRLGIVPTPKEMSLDGEEWDLSRFEIVLPPWRTVATGAAGVADCRVRAGVAAEEINDRVARLGGAALPVVEAASGGRPVLLLAPASEPAARRALAALGANAAGLPEQGYVIAAGREGGNPLVVCAGADRLGTLYAAATLRRMIVKRDDGKIVLLSGKVRDWPDFKVRRLGRASSKELVDLALRAKINGLYPGPREVNDYAHERGMILGMGGGVGIREYLTEAEAKELPAPRGEPVSWSHKDAHAKKAEATARTLKEEGVDYYFLHAVDTGAWSDPEAWSKRGQADREAYRDDEHGRAAGEQFALYRDILKKQNPDLMFEAVVYPYFFHSTDPDFWKEWHDRKMPLPCSGWDLGRGLNSQEEADRLTRELNEYHSRVAALLPDDTYICTRESSRKVLAGAFRLYPDHPFTVWVWPCRSQGWEGFFAPQIRTLASFYWADRRDVLFYLPTNIVMQLVGAEYAWNAASAPDADAGFSGFEITYEGGGSPKHVTSYQRDHLLPRVCRLVFGSAAPAFAPLFTGCLSAAYAHAPVATTRGRSTENWDDPYLRLAEVARGFTAAADAAEKAVADLDAGRVQGEYGDLREEWGAAYLLSFAEAAVHAAAASELEDAVRRVRDLRAAGKEAEAAAVTEEYLRKLPALAARLEKIAQRVKAAPGPKVRYRAGRNYPTETALDVKEWETRLRSGERGK